MSLIGPRPPLTYHPWPIEEYTKEQLHMFDVRPGFSGWAQIHGRKDVEWNHRIELNVWYILIFDVLIKDHFKWISNMQIFLIPITIICLVVILYLLLTLIGIIREQLFEKAHFNSALKRLSSKIDDILYVEININ